MEGNRKIYTKIALTNLKIIYTIIRESDDQMILNFNKLFKFHLLGRDNNSN